MTWYSQWLHGSLGPPPCKNNDGFSTGPSADVVRPGSVAEVTRMNQAGQVWNEMQWKSMRWHSRCCAMFRGLVTLSRKLNIHAWETACETELVILGWWCDRHLQWRRPVSKEPERSFWWRGGAPLMMTWKYTEYDDVAGHSLWWRGRFSGAKSQKEGSSVQCSTMQRQIAVIAFSWALIVNTVWLCSTILICKAKRQYLLTCKVSRCSLLALHGKILMVTWKISCRAVGMTHNN